MKLKLRASEGDVRYHCLVQEIGVRQAPDAETRQRREDTLRGYYSTLGLTLGPLVVQELRDSARHFLDGVLYADPDYYGLPRGTPVDAVLGNLVSERRQAAEGAPGEEAE